MAADARQGELSLVLQRLNQILRPVLLPNLANHGLDAGNVAKSSAPALLSHLLVDEVALLALCLTPFVPVDQLFEGIHVLLFHQLLLLRLCFHLVDVLA